MLLYNIFMYNKNLMKICSIFIYSILSPIKRDMQDINMMYKSDTK